MSGERVYEQHTAGRFTGRLAGACGGCRWDALLEWRRQKQAAEPSQLACASEGSKGLVTRVKVCCGGFVQESYPMARSIKHRVECTCIGNAARAHRRGMGWGNRCQALRHGKVKWEELFLSVSTWVGTGKRTCATVLHFLILCYCKK